MEQNNISVAAAFRDAWQRFTARPWIWVGAVLVVMIASSVSSGVLASDAGGFRGDTALLFVLNGIIQVLISMGAVAFTIRAYNDPAGVSLRDLWAPHPFWKFIGMQIVTGAIITLGFILLIVPGVIAAVGLAFTKLLVMDRKLGPIAAVKESWAMTKGHKWTVFLLVLALVGLNILGAVAFMVGLVVTIPVSMLAMMHLYRALSSTR